MGLFDNCIPEVRTTLAKATQDAIWLFGGGVGTTSGTSISESNATNIPTVWACVRILAETVAHLPLNVYKRIEPRGKELATNYWLYTLLHSKPNPIMTSMVFREVLMHHVVLWGNAYAWIERQDGKPIALWPLSPMNVEPVKITKDLLYRVIDENGKAEMFSNDEILHIPGLGFDGTRGYSVVSKAREAMGMAKATEQYGASFFGRGANPSGILTHPGQLGTEAISRLEKSIKDRVGGLASANNPLVLEEGMTWQQITMSNEDSQFLETRKFQIAEIARMFRIPLHKLQELDKATFSNIEQQSIEFVTDAIVPWLERFEQAYDSKLIFNSDRKTYFTEHVVMGLLRGDIESRYKAYNTGRIGGWLSANDIREFENLNPISDADGGNFYMVPLNMQHMGALMMSTEFGMGDDDNIDDDGNDDDVNDDDVNDDDGNNDNTNQRALSIIQSHQSQHSPTYTIRNLEDKILLTKSFYRLFKNAAQVIVNKEANAIKRAVEKIWKVRSIPGTEFTKFIEEFYGEQFKDFIVRSLLPVSMAYGEQLTPIAIDTLGVTNIDSKDIASTIDTFVRKYLASYAFRHVGSSQGQLLQLMGKYTDTEISDELIKRADEWLIKRADKIAADESIRQANAIDREVYIAGGITKLRWVTIGDNCPYCNSLNGKIVGTSEPFAEGSVHAQDSKGKWMTLSVPRAKYHPPIHRGCDCRIAPG